MSDLQERPQRSLSLRSSSATRRLHDCVDLVFSAREKAEVVRSLADFRLEGDATALVDSLAPMLDSPVKQHFLTLLHRVLPARHRSEFESACERRGVRVERTHADGLGREPAGRSPALPTPIVGECAALGERRRVASPADRADCPPRLLSLPLPRRRADLQRWLGVELCRGSRDGARGVYVAAVRARSAAAGAGLRPGDRLLGVGRQRVDGWTEAETEAALWTARRRSRVALEVQFEGRLPQERRSQLSFAWTDVHGRACSPPGDWRREEESPTHRRRRSAARHLSDAADRKVLLVASRTKPLGLSIRGGCDFDLGVFVTGVEPFSPAEAAGLRPGDQIVDVNGVDFLDISVREATRVLR